MSVALKAQPDVSAIDIIPVRQLVTVTLRPGSSMTAETLRGVIRAQGFTTPKDPVVTVRGTFQPPDVLELGPGRQLRLEGEVAALAALAPETEVVLTGTLLVGRSRRDSPPALVVSSAKIAAQPPR